MASNDEALKLCKMVSVGKPVKGYIDDNPNQSEYEFSFTSITKAYESGETPVQNNKPEWNNFWEE